MRVVIKDYTDPDGYRSQKLYVDGYLKLSVSDYIEPEDATISRDLNNMYEVADLMWEAYNAKSLDIIDRYCDTEEEFESVEDVN